jgi:hypothetical protein
VRAPIINRQKVVSEIENRNLPAAHHDHPAFANRNVLARSDSHPRFFLAQYLVEAR